MKRGEKKLGSCVPQIQAATDSIAGKKQEAATLRMSSQWEMSKPLGGTIHWGGNSEDTTNRRPEAPGLQNTGQQSEREDKISLLKAITERLPDFPGGPVVKTLHCHCPGGVGLIPGQRTKIPSAKKEGKKQSVAFRGKEWTWGRLLGVLECSVSWSKCQLPVICSVFEYLVTCICSISVLFQMYNSMASLTQWTWVWTS